MNSAEISRYAVAGNPVAHSQSPFIHASFAQQTGQAVNYERLLCPLDDFATTIRAFAAGGAQGCNVTVPFKFEAHALAARLSPRARLAGAVNTLRFDDTEGWFGDNTDGAGLVRDIERNAGVPLAGRRVLLLGAGGASAGVLGSLIAAHPAGVVMANRTLDKAQALIDSHAAWAREHGVAIRASTLADCPNGFDVLINGTSTSLAGSGVPVDAAVLAPGALALDMMYGPAAASFLAWAREHGAVARDGLGMLVEQAAEAFEVWRGVKPETAGVLAALRAKVEAKSASSS
ncbi:shikimate dehydrogenase [Paucibacter sp. R3-3]|uniref:Shikimate dehydrogenase (NADP(+)) n=1 Tax=Roseateles agri TaxID=3098619 RepID=A0ABU5DAH6_9BURK|nr:shikimate dehydrogenase [Paucibacter sp. R3-3]MDY0743254.1 shikimate dehydrogenase [Paucibacter sp. R3-3]